MKKLLLTGFGPFGKHKTNPSQDLVLRLHGSSVANYNIVGRVLPVSYNKAGVQLIDFIEVEKPDAIICLGLAANRTKVTPELIAVNYIHSALPDNDGVTKLHKKIIEQGENAYFTTLPIDLILEKLSRKNIPNEISASAGTYVCNLTKYFLMHYLASQQIKIPAGFIHIPECLEEKILTQAIAGCIECLS